MNPSCLLLLKKGEVFNAEDQPPRKRRLLSAVVRVEDEQDTVAELGKGEEGTSRVSRRLLRAQNHKSRSRAGTASDRFSGGSKPRVATGSFFAARDAYRKHPVISNNLKRATPELGIALAAFSVYLFVEGMTSKLASSPAKKESHH
ncbi:unnamed protein product [Sphagnum jensenii]|uniref:Uncharacterized protein n=1 Tax=Sphagnum jensenii TaxID=128206 RepID=A0ABP1AX70_9BRYO